MAGWHVGRRAVIAVAALGVLAGAIAAVPAAGALLPDNRRYELVSPPQKHGGDVLTSSLRTWAADDGDAVLFASLTGFGDVAGTGVATDYLATRVAGDPPAGSQGWTVHGVTPPQHALPIALTNAGFEPMDVLFTPDLGTGVFQSWDPLTSDSDVADVANLYLRPGFRSEPSSSFDLLTPCPACASSGRLAPFTATTFNMLPKVAGISTEGTRVLFESTLRLTGDATDGTSNGHVNLYEYADGALQDVGILPDGSVAASAVAGQGVGTGQTEGTYLPHALSSDGTRVAFTTSPTLCGGGRYPCGNLYLRDIASTPATSVQINATERTPADPAGPKPAIFWTMSADGQRVFFTTGEQLTNDDTNSNNDLYMFDASAPPGSRLTRISVQDPSLVGGGAANAGIVLGASDDGRTVYFTSSAPLVPGDPSFSGGASGIYMWTDAGGGPPLLRFVAPLDDVIENEIAGSTWTLGESVQSRVSPDGRFLLFAATNGNGVLSRYGQPDYDQGACTDTGAIGCRELYLYDADASTPQQQLRCVSCRPDGAPATASASAMSRAYIGAASSAGIFSHALANDGRVFFSTAEALVPEDVNGRSDAYEWENGQVHLLTDGQSSDDSFFLDASPDGADVFVATRAKLTGWDTDNSYDLYDVRQPLPGHPAGVLDPPAPSPACVPIDGCRGPVLQPPPLPTVSSVTFSGSGNLTEKFPRPLHCRAGTVRTRTSKGIRCVRRPRRRTRVRCRRTSPHGKQCFKAAVRSRKSGGPR